MKILIQGYYGHGNLGDDLMLQCIVRKIKEYAPDSEITILFRVKAEFFLDVAEIFDSDDTVKPCFVEDFRGLVKAIAQCNIFLFGGGTCIHNRGFAGIYGNIIARIFCKKVYFIGIGADRIDGFYRKLKAFISVNCAQLIYVRDRESYDFLRRFRLRKKSLIEANDLIWLGSYFEVKSSSESRSFVFSWRDFSTYLRGREDECLESVVRGVVNFLNEIDCKNLFIVNMADHIDDEVNAAAAHLFKRLSGLKVLYLDRASMATKLSYLSGSSMGLYARMHPFMIAKIWGKRALSIQYASKVVSQSRLMGIRSGLSLEQLFCPKVVCRALMDEYENPDTGEVDLAQMISKSKINFNWIIKEVV